MSSSSAQASRSRLPPIGSETCEQNMAVPGSRPVSVRQISFYLSALFRFSIGKQTKQNISLALPCEHSNNKMSLHNLLPDSDK